MELIRRYLNHEEENENYEITLKIRGSKTELQRLQSFIVDAVNTKE